MRMNDESMEDMTVAKDWKSDDKHKILTMDDVADNLEADFMDEISDSKKYMCMAKVADSAGNHHDCHYLLEMAKDEYTHARFIRGFMVEHNISIPEDQDKCYHKIEEEISKFFR